MAKKIIFYGSPWCGDCIRAKNVLDKHKIIYQYIGISLDQKSALEVERINNGLRSVPTIIFPNQTILIEPSNEQLETKLKEV